MLLVGLTGGIGSGKSTFAALLAERGAQIIDADLLGRMALRPGRPTWHSVVDQFGDEVLAATSMEIDRKRLAAVVFKDPEKLSALNAIVHPIIFKGIADALERLRATDEIVVLDAALLVETGLHQAVQVLIVVTASQDARRARLARGRGMSLDEIASRMQAQANEDDLIEKADIVVNNSGSLERLVDEADRVWMKLQELNKK